jgi:hypothetical protein
LRSVGVESPRSRLPIRVQPGRLPSSGTILDAWFQGLGCHPWQPLVQNCVHDRRLPKPTRARRRVRSCTSKDAHRYASPPFRRSVTPGAVGGWTAALPAYRGWLTGSEATSSDGDASPRCWSGSATSGRRRCARDGGCATTACVVRRCQASIQPGFVPTFAASRRLQLLDALTATHAR